MVPLDPVPLAPEVIVSHGALETALHEQVVPLVVTVKEFVPPDAPKDAAAELKPLTAHAAADCVTVWVCPPAVIVAVRDDAFGCADAEYSIVPLAPVPVAPAVIASHAALDVADHPQEDPFVETVTLPEPPDAATVAVAGASAVTAHAAADCVTACTCPPAVMVALRDEALGLMATEYAIVPLAPVPVAPEVIVSHAALDSAVQPHVEPLVVTVTLPLPPDAATVADAGASAVTAHAAADCVTTCTCPPAVIVAVRDEASGFDDTLYAIVPLVPVPVAPAVIASHAALDVAVQPQDAPLVVIVKELVPPAAAKDAVAALKPVTAHAAADCVTVWTCPPAVMVALRSTAFGFAAME